MRILWIKTGFLHPLDTGGNIRSYFTLRALRRNHRITFLTLATPDANTGRESAAEYAHDVVEVPWDGAPRRGSFAFAAQALRNLVASSMPLALERYQVKALGERLAVLIEERDFDVVVCDFLFPAPQMRGISGVPKVLFQHNVESLIWDRLADEQVGPLGLYYRLQARRMRRWEGRLCSSFDRVIAVSPQDARLMEERFDVDDVAAVPTGVDTEYFCPNAEQPEPGRVVFVGSLDWLPNIEGVAWLVREVWPRVVRERPDARLDVVGRRPTAATRRLIEGRPDVRLSADVPDVRPHLHEASAVVVPLHVGGGTRLKIFEAMACGKAVISTPVGAEGLPVESGKDCMIAEETEAFAATIVRVLDDDILRSRLERAARTLVEEEHSWERSAERFAAICAEASRSDQRKAGRP